MPQGASQIVIRCRSEEDVPVAGFVTETTPTQLHVEWWNGNTSWEQKARLGRFLFPLDSVPEDILPHVKGLAVVSQRAG